MGPGHFGIALAAKPAAPKAPLWVLLVASEALDLLSFGFVAIGVEKIAVTQTDFVQGLKVITPGSVPWSHGLFMSVIWSAVMAALAFLVWRERRVSLIVGLVVFSHWVLDFVVHPPDLPLLFSGSPLVGLGLWTSGPGLIASIILELALLAGGAALYLRVRRKR